FILKNPQQEDSSVVVVSNDALKYRRIFKTQKGNDALSIDVHIANDVCGQLTAHDIKKSVAILAQELPKTFEEGWESSRSIDPNPGYHKRIIHALPLDLPMR